MPYLRDLTNSYNIYDVCEVDLFYHEPLIYIGHIKIAIKFSSSTEVQKFTHVCVRYLFHPLFQTPLLDLREYLFYCFKHIRFFLKPLFLFP